jgi:hypothetical protein
MLRMQEMVFPGFKFQKQPQFMHGIFATQVAFLPPPGKSLKKALTSIPKQNY